MLKWILPGAIWLGLALLPILFFYFLRVRFRAQPVSSIYIWSRLQNVTTEGSRLRRRSVLLLLLQIATALAAITAIAGPFLFVRHLAAPGIAYLVDVSASMNAAESLSKDSQTRLEAAREILAKEIRGMDPKTNCMVFLCDTQARPLAGPTLEHGRILSSLNQIKASNAGFNEAEVSSQLQAWLGAQKGSWQAFLISDGGLDLGGQSIAKVFGGRVKAKIIGKERRNLGVAGLRLLGSKASFFINNGWPSERTVQISLVYQERTLARAALDVPPGLSNQALALDVQVKPGVYRIQLDQNHDALNADDFSYLAVNQQRRFRVLQVGPANPFLQSILGHPNIELTSLPEFPEALQGYWDLIIADRVEIPPDLRANLLSFVRIPPKAPVSFTGNISGMLDPAGIFHPLLRFVRWDGVQVADGHILKVKPGLPVLAEVAGEPVVAAWEEDGFQRVICGFDLYTSNFGLSGAFPIFFQNLLQWLTPQGGNQLAYNLTVGEPMVFGESPAWRILADEHFDLDRRGPLIEIRALKSGFFQWKGESDRGFLVANPPFGESDLAPQPLHFKQAAVTAAAELAIDQIPLTQWPLLVLLGCLLAEWIIWRGGWQLKKGVNLNVVD